jgi:CBS-domain-containing membrane protein
MSTKVIACKLEDAVESAIKLMSEHRVRRLPVIDQNGSCVGIISQADLLSRAADNMEAVVDLLQQISAPHSKLKEESADSAAEEETPAEKKEKTPRSPEKAETTAEKPAGAAEKTAVKQGGGKKKKN